VLRTQGSAQARAAIAQVQRRKKTLVGKLVSRSNIIKLRNIEEPLVEIPVQNGSQICLRRVGITLDNNPVNRRGWTLQG
jgi:hypothetical protein